MPTTKTARCRFSNFAFALILTLSLFPLTGSVQAAPPGIGSSSHDWLNYWAFSNTNTWETELYNAPVSFTNLDVSNLGNGNAVLLDRTNAAWLQYRVVEANGSNNLVLDTGSVMFWFAPSWSGTNQGGTGPGQAGRLIEAGSYTTNASYGWWSIYLDPAGVNIYFSGQTNNGGGTNYLSAPIAWATNRWHLIALTYSPTNSTLYLDGELVTNGLPVTYLPNSNVLTNGFYIGSDNTGVAQARGIFDNLSTYSFQLNQQQIGNTYLSDSFYFLMNPMNAANFDSAPSTPVYGPDFSAIAGAGYLEFVRTNSNCVTSTNVWITNMVATIVGTNATNQSVTFTFDIAGGSNSLPYDVFATASFVGSSITNSQWAWMGQGYHCNTYTITNLPSRTFFLLGTPLDSDLDGLTDAYERLVSKTNPLNPDTDGDGMMDGWEVIQGLNPLVDETAVSGSRANYVYDLSGWLNSIFGSRTKTIGLNAEGSILQLAP